MTPNYNRYYVTHQSDVINARRSAREVAQNKGFDHVASEEIALVVSELGSNLVRHASGGVITLEWVSEDSREGLLVCAEDSGPGIADVEHAFGDGVTTAGSLGYGLGTVNRLMDRVDINSKKGQEHGTVITCVRWLPQTVKTSQKQDPILDIGAASRPHPGLTLNGDAYVIKAWQNRALVAVIDGLGHGQYANRASFKARQYVERHYEQQMNYIFQGVGRSCRATRGVVMALASFDLEKMAFKFASVGNIETRLIGSQGPFNYRIRRGIIGLNAPAPAVSEHHWQPGLILIMHSDGLSTHWHWSDYKHLCGHSSNEIAQELLSHLAKDNDDATVVVIKQKDK